jgi:toluene monooxygenase electron transfer component
MLTSRTETPENSPCKSAKIVSIVGRRGFFQKVYDDSILQAALRSGIGVRYECSSGGCGSCRIKVVSGETEDLWPDAPGLSHRDRRKKLHLACQTRAVSDVEIEMIVDEVCVPRIIPRVIAIRLVSVRDLTHDIREFHFQGPGTADFIAGQYAILRTSDGSRRCYSMSNLSNKEGVWEFQVKRVPNGKVSNVLFALKTGDILRLDGPYGLAHLVEESTRPVVCIAGGSGLAPMISIARSIGSDPSCRLDFFYGGRTAADIVGSEYLSAMPGWGDKIHYHPVVSLAGDPLSTGWTGATGFVHEAVKQSLGERIRESEIYFAGPPAMVEALQRLFIFELKIPFDQVHFDRFF